MDTNIDTLLFVGDLLFYLFITYYAIVLPLRLRRWAKRRARFDSMFAENGRRTVKK